MAKSKGGASRPIDPKSFPLDVTMTMPHRLAACLDYFAGTHPRMFLDWRIIYQAVTGQTKLPRTTDREVILLKSRMCAARKILEEKYSRSTRTLSPVGVRATVDDADRGAVLMDAARKAKSANVRLKKEIQAVNVRNIPDTAQNATVRAFLVKSSKHTLDSIDNLLKTTLLLAAKPEDKVRE